MYGQCSEQRIRRKHMARNAFSFIHTHCRPRQRNRLLDGSHLMNNTIIHDESTIRSSRPAFLSRYIFGFFNYYNMITVHIHISHIESVYEKPHSTLFLVCTIPNTIVGHVNVINKLYSNGQSQTQLLTNTNTHFKINKISEQYATR